MSLRLRIALTFLVLLTAVLVAAVSGVSVADRASGEIAVRNQVATNSDMLTEAAQALARDFAFRKMLAFGDVDTLVSVLDNNCQRVGAAMAVVTSLDGRVIAAYGMRAPVGSYFPSRDFQSGGVRDGDPYTLLVAAGTMYQVVAVDVRSPLPVARIAIGFALDKEAQQRLATIPGIESATALHVGNQWLNQASRQPIGGASSGVTAPTAHEAPGRTVRQAKERLAASLRGVEEPFRNLHSWLLKIAGVSLCVFAGAAFWLARNITRPLRELTQSVEKIRDGDYELQLALTRRDELGVLAEGLDLMRTAVMKRDRSIRRLAYEDTLTGLMNRTAFSAALAAALAEGRDAPIGVAVINLHRFRRINEHLGYSVGDAVLITTGSRLAAVPSVSGAVARLAADEFAAFARLADVADLRSWGASLLTTLSEPVAVEAQPIDISATVGLAMAPGDAALAGDLLRCADLALERARRDKRPLAVYEAANTPGARDQLSLLGELRRAIQQDEFRLYYQPKIDLPTGRVAGAEVLLRWQHPVRGLLSPDKFIPFAEQTGFIRRITHWALDHAIAQAAERLRAGAPLPLAVNISADDLGDVRLDARIAGLLSRHQLPPALLTLEITESGFIEDPATALGILDALATRGVNVSVDDFGTGYSSLSHLARMPANEVKIDRGFVQSLDGDMEYAAIIRSAIEMAHSLGMKVVAEGIETASAATCLRGFGCDIGQGYLYAKPLPLGEFLTWLSGRETVPVVAIPIDFKADEVTDTLTLARY